ncbi:transporter substrate-binding domain-containing protein [Candidatus Puniceispirillum sp.]|uniref:transporter substrate-binding domain-containing protein n=1 Tax=Candidatus Puniceispirillum sp. TaxID=2026719 RepID=UPI001EC9EF3A|nr:transporter substrate-binding domain-containing protein [Candidatus Puniceispirillum sp.]
MKLTRILKAKAAMALVAVFGVVATSLPAVADDLIADIQKRGTLKVGMSTFVPWAMRDKQGGLIGFEIDVATKLAADMGVEVEFVPTAWSGIIPSLLAKKFDVIIGGMSITPQRNLTVNFTTPYAHSGQMMAANTKLAGNYTTIADYNQASVTIACRRGATPCKAAQKLFPKSTLRQFDDDAQAFQEVVNGNAHAMVSSAPKPRFWSEAYPNEVFVAFDGENLTRGNEGFALRKGDSDALNFFSNWIVVNTSSGWLKDRHDFWFKNRSGWKDMVKLEQ